LSQARDQGNPKQKGREKTKVGRDIWGPQRSKGKQEKQMDHHVFASFFFLQKESTSIAMRNLGEYSNIEKYHMAGFWKLDSLFFWG